MSSLLICSLSGSPVIQGVINKQTGHIYEKSTILCHLRTYHTCPHTGGALSETDLLPIITGQSNTLLTQSRSIAEMLEQLGNEYDSLVLEGFVSKEELQKVREELAVSLYQQDAALRVIAKLKCQIELKREEVVRLMDQVRLRANSTA